MSLLKRKAEDLQQLRDIAADVDESLFVPYACHFDPHTILTKNGELLQTLKVVGFTYEDITKESEDLRRIIRRALRESLQTTDYAVWLHTIRRKASLAPPGEYPENFSKQLNQKWNQHNNWHYQYVNEVYVTIVREGQTAKLRQPQHMARSLIPKLEKEYRWSYLQESCEELTRTVDRIHVHLANFGARKLGLVEQNGVVISEPVTFLHKLTSLVETPMPLPDIGLADYLTQFEVTFGFNAMEVRQPNGQRRFGSVLTLKNYRELPSESVDLLLQSKAEFIISQCMDFVNSRNVLKEYSQQREYFELSEEEDLPEQTGLNEIIASNRGSAVDFGEHQINLFVQGDSVKELEQNIRNMVAALNGIGVLAVREDIKFEEAYWAQLPANFEFLRRLNSIAATRVGGFANISNLPAGLASGSRWGPPITAIKTALGTPYFFNFHNGDNGHTLFLGPEGVGKTVLLNFLLSEARKLSPRLFFFDKNQSSEVFLRAMGAEYHFIERRVVHASELQDRPAFHSRPQLNPLSLPDTAANRSFLLTWLDACFQADPFYRPEMSEEAWPIFQQALEVQYTLPPEQRSLASLVEYLKEYAPKLAAKMYGWVNEGKLARWFDHNEDTLDLSSGLVGLDMTQLAQHPKARPAVAAYLLHRVMLELDGRPAMIVLDEAWDLLDNPIFKSRMGAWLETLRSKNAIAILATEKPDAALHSSLSAAIMQQVATQIYLPNPAINRSEYEALFGLNEVEAKTVQQMQPSRRQFLLKRGLQSICCQLDLKALPGEVAVLSAKAAGVRVMTKIISDHKNADPAFWLPRYLAKVMEELE